MLTKPAKWAASSSGVCAVGAPATSGVIAGGGTMSARPGRDQRDDAEPDDERDGLGISPQALYDEHTLVIQLHPQRRQGLC